MTENNLLTSFLTSFLTSILNTKRQELVDKAKEIILHLLYTPGNTSYVNKIAKCYGRDRREYFYIIKKLENVGIIQFQGVRSSCKLYKLNSDVKKNLNKMLEGVVNSAFSSSQPLKPQTDLSKNADVYRAHRHVTFFKHNLSNFRFHQLRGKWSHNNSRVVLTEFFDNDYFDIVFTRTKCIIYSPVAYGSIQEYSKLRSFIGIRVGKLAAYLERKYHIQLEVEEEKLFADKYEIACQDPLNSYAAERMKEEGYTTVTYPDWQMDCSVGTPEIDLNQGWYQVSREGYGPELYDRMLHFPETFDSFVQEYRHNTAIVLQKIQTLQTPQQSLNEEQHWDRITLILENLLTYTMERLATKDDVESLREDLNKMATPRGARCNEIIFLLSAGAKTLSELATEMNMTKPAVLRYIKQLLSNGEITEEIIKGNGRGRPQKKYRLKDGE